MIGPRFYVHPEIVLALCIAVAPAAQGATSYDQRAKILAPVEDFSKAERFETLSGGSATNTRRLDREAFSQPSANLSFADRGEFFVGNGFLSHAENSLRSRDVQWPALFLLCIRCCRQRGYRRYADR